MTQANGTYWNAVPEVARTVPVGWRAYTSPPCPFCDLRTPMVVPDKSFQYWRDGKCTPKEAFPNFSLEEIEIMINGTHLACWDEAYGYPQGNDSAAEAENLPGEG